MIPIPRGLLNEILAQYGVEGEPVQELDPVWQVRGNKRTYCLKQFKRPDGLEFQVAVAAHLHKKNFHACPRYYKTQTGSAIAEADGCWYLLSNWVEGRKPNVRDAAELKLLVEQLAHFHRHATGLTDKKGERLSCGAVRWHEFRQTLLDRWSNLVAWEKEYDHPALRKALSIAEKSIHHLHLGDCTELAETELQKNTFAHGDYNFSNAILRPNGQMSMIDLDASAYQVRLYDLMHLIQRNWGVDADLAKRMLLDYHRVRRLSPLEFDVLMPAVSFPAQFWRVINIARYRGQQITEEQLERWSERYLSRRAALELRKLRYTNL